MGGPRIQAGAAAFLAFAAALHCLVTPDLWWHLASGRWILAHRTVPRTDVFTWTISDHAWVDLQWLTDVLMVSVWQWAGPEGLILGKALAFAVAAALAVAAGRAAGGGAAAAGLAGGLAVLASAERTLARPEIATYVGLGLTLLAIHRVRAGCRRWAFVPPVTALAWANLHALAFLGPATVLLHAGLSVLERHLPERLRGDPANDPAKGDRAARDLGLSGVAAAIALLANPYGFATWTFPLTLLRRIDGSHEVFARILEFAPLLDDPGDPILRSFWVLLVIVAAVLLGRLPRLALAPVLSLVPFLFLAFLARRNVPLFAWAAVPVLAPALSSLARARFARLRTVRVGRAAPALAMVLVGIALLGGASPRLLGLHRDRGLAVTPGLFPEDCLVVLDAAGPDTGERLFHDLDFGGYLVWRNPARRSFIDGRLEVCGPDWFERFVRAHEDPAAWERLRDSWDLDALLLEHSAAGSAGFLRARLAGGLWEPACFSPEAALLVPGDGDAWRRDQSLRPGEDDWSRLLAENRGSEPGAGSALAFLRPVHDRLAGHPCSASIHRAVRLAGLCLTLEWFEESRAGYRAVLAADPANAEAWANLGICEMRAGNRSAARRIWGEGMTHVRRSGRQVIGALIERAGPEGDDR